VNRFLSLAVTLVLILTLAGCGAGTAAPTQPEITPAPSAELTEEPLESTASAVTSEPVQTGLFAEQIFSGADGDIHYSYYLPDSYDGSRKFPMMVVMPDYNMMWFGEDSSGSNLNWNGFTAWTRLDTEMVVVSAQLTDWGEKSARQAIELTEYFINSFAVDTSRGYAAGYSAGGETMPGLTTGFSDVDRKINGLNKSDLLLLAGRPGMGKTSMGLNVAVNAAKASRKTVAVFSLEMSREQLVTRLLAGEGLIDNTRLVTGNLRESDWVRIAEGASTLSRLDIRIDDNPLLTVADMNAKCRRLDDLGLVVIDYLQLMTSAGGKGYSGENRQQAVSDISRMLKIMAKELQVPVLCLSQLSRANEKRDDKRPMLSDLRESGAIEQDADIVMFLYRDDYYNSDSEKRNIAECIVAKNRHGETGKVELRWLPEYTSFGTLENRYQEEN
jgi:replicative DNA helicase